MKPIKGLLPGSRVKLWIARNRGDMLIVSEITFEYQDGFFHEEDPYHDPMRDGRSERIDWNELGETQSDAIVCKIQSLTNLQKSLEKQINEWKNRLELE